MLSFRRAIAAQDDFDVKKSKNIPKRDSEYVDCDVHRRSSPCFPALYRRILYRSVEKMLHIHLDTFIQNLPWMIIKYDKESIYRVVAGRSAFICEHIDDIRSSSSFLVTLLIYAS